LCQFASQLATEEHDECLAEGAGPSRDRSLRIAHESWDARVDEIRGHFKDKITAISFLRGMR
jgi:hypothetical protein